MAKNSGNYYIGKARSGGCRVEYGRGDHVKLFPPNGGRPMVIPKTLKGNGTEFAIVKWLRALGIVITLIGLISYFT